MTGPAPDRAFVPAAGHDRLLPLYDPLLRLLGRERAIKGTLIAQADLAPGRRVLDLGCGTGTLAVRLAREHPRLEIHAADPDPKALARAARKARDAGVTLRFARAFADDLPYPDAHFDRVLSSFVFHHLAEPEKCASLREARRVLRPDGSLHLLDFGPATDGRRGLLARLLHHGERLRDNLEGRIPELMQEAGFRDARQLAHRRSLFGTLAYYRASSRAPSWPPRSDLAGG
jgi:cyclopropane fatty-acyl-phospholipid synthase-like methyltransferase